MPRGETSTPPYQSRTQSVVELRALALNGDVIEHGFHLRE